jgi:hypothetical protein
MSNILSRVISSTVEEGWRIVKVLCFGKDDVRTADAVAPYGIDSNPIKDASAVYAPTADMEQAVIIGYLNPSAKAEKGELRLYSTNEAGDEKTYVWLKADGTLLIGGNADNAVRYTPLNAGLQDLKTAINTELGKIQTAITSLGGSYAKLNVSVNISGAKINEVKTS